MNFHKFLRKKNTTAREIRNQNNNNNKKKTITWSPASLLLPDLPFKDMLNALNNINLLPSVKRGRGRGEEKGGEREKRKKREGEGERKGGEEKRGEGRERGREERGHVHGK